MTDEELLLWLRSEDTHLTDCAADRIEALLNLNEALVELMDDRDSKLAKAVEALGLIVVDDAWGLEHETYMKCRATLAEIKGESHD